MRILYNGLAVGAAEGAVPTSEYASSYSRITDIVNDDTAGGGIVTLEHNAWVLDGSRNVLKRGTAISMWSTEVSDEDCSFVDPPSITISLDNYYSSAGLYIRFAPGQNEYCSEIEVVWMRDGAEIERAEQFPTSTTHIVPVLVEDYDAVTITFNRTSVPNRSVKVEYIAFGIVREFGDKDIRRGTAHIISEIDPTGESIPESTFDWELETDGDMEYMFDAEQSVSIYGDSLIGVFYITDSDRITKTHYSLQATDAIGMLDYDTFGGGIYSNQYASSILYDVIGGQFTLDSAFSASRLSGYIEPGVTRREALRQILFSLGACASTDGSGTIRIFPIDAESPAEIEPSRVYMGGNVRTEHPVSSVTVRGHTYTRRTPTTEEEYVVVNGQSYVHTYTDYTVSSQSARRVNAKEFTDMTLVSTGIAQATAQRLMDWYERRTTHSVAFVQRDERIGDNVTTHTDYGATHTGIIRKTETTLYRFAKVNAEIVGDIE